MLDDMNEPVLHTARMRQALTRLSGAPEVEPEIRAIAARALSDPAGLAVHEVDVLAEALMRGGSTGPDAKG